MLTSPPWPGIDPCGVPGMLNRLGLPVTGMERLSGHRILTQRGGSASRVCERGSARLADEDPWTAAPVPSRERSAWVTHARLPGDRQMWSGSRGCPTHGSARSLALRGGPQGALRFVAKAVPRPARTRGRAGIKCPEWHEAFP